MKRIRPNDVLIITGVLAGVLLLSIGVYLWSDARRKPDLFAQVQASAPQSRSAGPAAPEAPVLLQGADLARHNAESSDKSVRINAINNLALFPPDAQTKGLLESIAAYDPEGDVRAAALKALGALGIGEEQVFLSAMSRGGLDASGAVAGLLAQGKISDVGRILSTALRDPAIAPHALSAAEGLRESAFTDPRRIYQEALYQPDPGTVRAAITKIFALPPQDRAFFLGDLTNIASSGPEEIRSAAAAAAASASAPTMSGESAR